MEECGIEEEVCLRVCVWNEGSVYMFECVCGMGEVYVCVELRSV